MSADGERRASEVRVGSTAPGDFVVSVAHRSLAAQGFQWMAFVALAAATALVDQLGKQLAATRLALGETVDLVGPLSLTHVRNSGIAFGLLSSFTATIGLVTALVLIVLVAWFARAGASHPLAPLALGLIAGGSLSNLVDRLRLGYVTDYLSVPHWPSFNLADCFIVAGVAVVVAVRAHADLSSA